MDNNIKLAKEYCSGIDKAKKKKSNIQEYNPDTGKYKKEKKKVSKLLGIEL